MIRRHSHEKGFTAVEVLITLFIVGFILASGYQTYALVTDDAGKARERAEASNIAYEELRRIQGTVTSSESSCATSTPTAEIPAASTLPTPRSITAAITCPFGTSNPVSLVTITVTYGPSSQKVVHGVYAK